MRCDWQYISEIIEKISQLKAEAIREYYEPVRVELGYDIVERIGTEPHKMLGMMVSVDYDNTTVIRIVSYPRDSKVTFTDYILNNGKVGDTDTDDD